MNGVASWFKPPRHAAPPPDAPQSTEETTRPIPLHEVLGWEPRWQRLLYRVLVPVDLLAQFRIDPITLTDDNDQTVVRVVRGQSGDNIRFELYHEAGAQDALVELELADTQFNQIEVLWLALQNPYAKRFDTDVMPDGQTTMRGTVRRNVAAEEEALKAGLAPGQVRGGLGAFNSVGRQLETFMSCLNQHEYVAQPLYYHTAVLFERIGFAYSQGHAQMQRIDRGFAPGGALSARLDGSGPFRDPALANSVRGRAWAIHTGILDQPWDRVRMYKRLGIDADVDTCPGLPW